MVTRDRTTVQPPRVVRVVISRRSGRWGRWEPVATLARESSAERARALCAELNRTEDSDLWYHVEEGGQP